MDVRHVHFADAYLEIPGTKTDAAFRTMPLHAQLAGILRPYVRRGDRVRGKNEPLFPSDRTGTVRRCAEGARRNRPAGGDPSRAAPL
jgi:integrase